MQVVIGMDGGGTGTRAWVAQVDGRVLGVATGSASNVFHLGVDAAARELTTVAQRAWAAAEERGGQRLDVRGLFAGVAGAGAAADQAALASALARELGLEASVCRVDHDLRVAHAGSLAGAPGVVLIAGTGAACYGRTADGQTARAGGWGPILDDGGSGHWLGIQAMRAIVRGADGRAEEPEFRAAVLTHLGIGNLRAMIEGLRAGETGGLSRARVATLAPLVLTAAMAGDTVADRIAAEGARELAAMAASVMRRLAMDARPVGRVACVGGVIERDDHYRDRVMEALAELVPGVHAEPPGLPPVGGAVLLALENTGRRPSTGTLTRLLEAMESDTIAEA
ncbi:N-acetylglucosamine kinase [Congregicoccus parvus]|uniref:N-acetylglucosamine kinase n=1 Tax=Congregicoccus parvus TaxID=3081749 RepID=UPI003FA5B2E6